MNRHDLIIDQEDAALLDQCIIRYVEETKVRVAIVIGRDGHLVAQQGETKSLDIESLCALAVGAFASSEALAGLVGEENFNSIFHQGVKCNVYIAMVGDDYLLLSLFDYHASAPMVRLQAKISSEAIINILDRSFTHSRNAQTEV